MKQEAHEILKKCLANHRYIVLSGKSACIGIMKDYGGREHPEINLLADAMEDQIPDRLDRSQPVTAEIIAAIASQFAANRFYTQDMAEFAVQSWADALDLWTLDSSKFKIEDNEHIETPSVANADKFVDKRDQTKKKADQLIPERGEDYALPVTCDLSWTKVNMQIDMNDGRGHLDYVFDIPYGSKDGKVLLLSGQGKIGKNGGLSGDLRLTLKFSTKSDDKSVVESGWVAAFIFLILSAVGWWFAIDLPAQQRRAEKMQTASALARALIAQQADELRQKELAEAKAKAAAAEAEKAMAAANAKAAETASSLSRGLNPDDPNDLRVITEDLKVKNAPIITNDFNKNPINPSNNPAPEHVIIKSNGNKSPESGYIWLHPEDPKDYRVIPKPVELRIIPKSNNS